MKTAIKLLMILLVLNVFYAQNTKEIVQTGTVTDIDGNVYKTVKIGTQIWMAENLKVTKYQDGTLIQNVKEQEAWTYLTTGAYCYYNNDVNNRAVYGNMYNYFAVTDSRKLAPKGWHIPTRAEWETLINYLGGDAGGANQKLREAGYTHFVKKVRTVGNNESGFTALPGGERWADVTRGFEAIGGQSSWWTVSLNTTESSRAWVMHINDVSAKPSHYPKGNGIYVRCIKDID